MLGAVHEHQQPSSPLVWDKPAVIQDHAGIWNAKKVDSQIFKKYEYDKVSATTFDPLSVMLYPIKKSWIKNKDLVFKSNTEPSDLDKRAMSAVYPFASVLPVPPAPNPLKRPESLPPKRLAIAAVWNGPCFNSSNGGASANVAHR
jgi:hypothetical protein